MKPFAFLALSTSLVLGLLQACSTANPHAGPLPDCIDPTCTITALALLPPVPDGGADADTAAVPDTSGQ